uniref:Uncharacterized protein n=1 Tax=Podoviridae sp. cthau23 TaxID=2825268 RepID=A0A8S5U796_9CAUD|nr:MAG TPA: hypothetical protein [Podoviridae sp. cthau23]
MIVSSARYQIVRLVHLLYLPIIFSPVIWREQRIGKRWQGNKKED